MFLFLSLNISSEKVVNLQLIFSLGRGTSVSSCVGMRSSKRCCVGWQAKPCRSGGRGSARRLCCHGEILTGSYQQLPAPSS